VLTRWKRGLIAELARIARELHSRRVYHKDLYLCHFYIPSIFIRSAPSDWKNQVVMIDLHRLGRHSVTGLWWQIKDLGQLLFSSAIEGVTVRDRIRFWRLYRREWPNERGPGNWLRPLVRWKARRYEKHNERKPAAVPYDRDRAAA
jgi:heptose I phosphotransferase